MLKHTGQNALEVDIVNVAKAYGGNPALIDVSLTVQPGEMLFLLGPSGCGKTTLLRILAGLLQPDAGRVLMNKKDVTAVPAHRRGIGLVFQNYALFPHMTVGENLAFGLRMRKVPRARRDEAIQAALNLVQLGHVAHRYPRQLSGGQQQRVAVARAIATEPALLLLDEPLSNLDAKLRQEMRLELRSLQQRLGITTVFVTHDQEEALSMASRIAIMADGLIHAIDTPEHAYHNPRTRFAATFLGEGNLIEGTVARVADARAQITTGSGLRLAARTLEPAVPEVAVTVMVRPEKVRLNDAAVSGEDINRVAATVEDIVFSGAVGTCFARSADGIRWQIRYLAEGIRLQAGQSVHLSWRAEDAVVIPASAVASVGQEVVT